MMYTKYLRWALLGGLLLVFFIPFIIANGQPLPSMFFPFITGKNFAFRILIELLLGIYILLAVREPKYRPKTSLLMWVVLAFVLWVGVGTVFGVDPVKSFWSNFERMEGYITVLHLFVYFVIAGAVVTAEDWWEKVFQTSIASSVIMGCYAMLQLAGKIAISSQSGPRVDSTFGNATYLAVFMLFNIFTTLFMLVRKRHSSTAQMLYGVALVLQVLSLYYTETRGALLGVIGGLVVAAVYIAWRGTAREWQPLRKIAMYGLGAIVVLVAVFFAVRHTSFVQNSATLSRLSSISISDPTTIARLQIWQMAYQGFRAKPIVGWGQENFNFVFNRYYQPSMYAQEQWFDRAHDQFLDWLIAAGLPAFLLYISLFVLAAWAIMRTDKLSVPEQAIWLGLLAAYAFNNLFVFDDVMSSIYFFTVLAFAHSLSRQALPGWMFLSRSAGDRTVAVIAPFVVVGVVLGGWALNAPGIARAKNLVTAVTPQVAVSNGNGGITGADKDPKVRLQEFQTALGRNAWPGTQMGRQEAVEQLLQYASAAAGSTSIDPAVKQDTFNLASSSAVALLASRPHDARLELFFGAFYDTFNQSQQALKYLNEAIADSPKKQPIMFEIGVVYLNAGDTKNAVFELKQAFDEAPTFNDARILYAASLYYDGDSKDADALLIQGFGTVLVDDSRILQVYVNLKQYDRVVGIWQLRVKASPNDGQAHVGLAAAYFAAGNKTGAVDELKRAAELSPSLAPQIQTVITQIQNGTLKP